LETWRASIPSFEHGQHNLTNRKSGSDSIYEQSLDQFEDFENDEIQ
jgi:hypothetical protein